MAFDGIPCRECGAQFIHQRAGLRGRPPVSCDGCRAARAETARQPRPQKKVRPKPLCEGCGALDPNTIKGLCRGCMAENKKVRLHLAKRAANGRTCLPPLLRHTPIGSIPLCKCKACGVEYKPKTKDRTSFCSRQCSWDWQKIEGPAKASGLRVLHSVYRYKCAGCGERKEGRTGTIRCAHCSSGNRNPNYTHVKGTTRHCANCSAPFVAMSGEQFSSTKFCSKVCQNALARTRPGYREMQKQAKARRRARKKGAAKIERVSPTKVFERDGWRCGICGKLTLQTKRGKMHPRAPELDHIVTLADGGDHTYANTQCACRKCNGLKGAKTYGQLHLFPAG